jgi:hypothetical protein
MRLTDKLDMSNKHDWDHVQMQNIKGVNILKDAFEESLLQDNPYHRIRKMRDSQLEYVVADKAFLTETLDRLNLYVREIVNNHKPLTRYDDALIREIGDCIECDITMKFTQNHITRTEELVRSVLLNDDLFRLIRGYFRLVLVDIIENPNSHEDYAASTFAYLNAIRAAIKAPHGRPLFHVLPEVDRRIFPTKTSSNASQR